MEIFENKIEEIISLDLHNFMSSFDIEQDNNSILSLGFAYFQTFSLTFLQVLNSVFGKLNLDYNFAYVINTMSERINKKCFENFAKICKAKIFDLILGYPDTEKIIYDLSEALEKSNMVNVLLKILSFSNSFILK